MLMMFEVIGVLLNSHPLFWLVGAALGTMPLLAALASYFLWAKVRPVESVY